MFCKNCGNEMNKEQAICLKCGVKTGVGNKHCGNCGKEVAENASVCLGCGFAIKNTSSSPINSEIVSKINKEFMLKNIIAILVGIFVIGLFFPFCTILSSQAGYGNDLSITGFEALLGVELTAGHLSSGFFGFVMVILPIALVVCNYVKGLAKFKKPMLLIAPVGTLVSQIIAERTLAGTLNVDATVGFGYWVTLLSIIAMVVVGFLQFKNVPLTKEGISQYIKK